MFPQSWKWWFSFSSTIASPDNCSNTSTRTSFLLWKTDLPQWNSPPPLVMENRRHLPPPTWEDTCTWCRVGPRLWWRHVRSRWSRHAEKPVVATVFWLVPIWASWEMTMTHSWHMKASDVLLRWGFLWLISWRKVKLKMCYDGVMKSYMTVILTKCIIFCLAKMCLS